MKIETNQKRWALRLVFVALGSCFTTLGIVGLKNVVWWIRGFNYQLGQVQITCTLYLVILGSIFVLIGLIPWGKRTSRSNRKRST
jgi:uncharacterized membrane protein YqjE